MKHKLSYSLLLSLVVLFSFSLAHAQTVDIVGPDPADDPLLPNTSYCYDVVVTGAGGVTAFTLPIDVSGAGFASGSLSTMPGLPGVIANIVGDQVQLGYSGSGPAIGDPATLITICLTTTDDCGADVVIEPGVMAPAGGPLFSDGCFVGVQVGGLTNTLYNGTPVCGTNADENLACGDEIVNKQINATEPIGLALTYNQIAGVGSTDPVTGLYNYTPVGDECDFTSTVQVEVTNPCANTVTCSFDVIYDQAAPVLTVPADQIEHWNQGAQTYLASATDDGCPTPSTLTFSITGVAPAAPFNGIGIDGGTGEITFDPACADVGMTYTVTVKVTDGCEFVEDDFDITVTNDLPTIVCPGDVSLWYSYWGPISLPFTAGDGTDPVTVTVIGADNDATGLGDDIPTNPMVISGSYVFDWQPEWADEGTWAITLQVDDGCQQATCIFYITVKGKFQVCIDTTSVYSGQMATVALSVTNSMPVGGFDFLVTYDPTMAFIEAEAINDLESWDYFTYRKSYQDNCGGGCPTGVLRLIGIVDLPDGLGGGDNTPEGDIVNLTFRVPENLSYIGQCFHVSFTWYDCGDNTMSSIDGNVLFIAQDFDLLDPDDWPLPGVDCKVGIVGKGTPDPRIDFNCDGWICVITPPDDRGDVNLNGIPNEIADAVLYSNYFVQGPGVVDCPSGGTCGARTLASDINDDGVPWTIADLVYLIRIITGDAIPYGESGEGGKVAPFADAADIGYEIGDNLVVSSYAPVSVGGAAFVFRHTGEIGTPVLTDDAAGMTIRTSDKNGELRVLVFSMEHNTITAGNHDLFTLPLNGATIELVETQFSDAEGNLLSVNTNKIAPPTAYELLQNYPNPFNAGTAIRFALPVASDWSLGVYNVAGQLIQEFKGHNDAGMVNLHWNADVASGIYFYKLSAGDFTDTKKMVLMK